MMIKVIVDANIILSALVGGEITDILLSPKLEPIAPELLFVEVRKHKEEIKTSPANKFLSRITSSPC